MKSYPTIYKRVCPSLCGVRMCVCVYIYMCVCEWMTYQSDADVQTLGAHENDLIWQMVGDLIGRPISMNIIDRSVDAIGVCRDLTDRGESQVSMLTVECTSLRIEAFGQAININRYCRLSYLRYRISFKCDRCSGIWWLIDGLHSRWNLTKPVLIHVIDFSTGKTAIRRLATAKSLNVWYLLPILRSHFRKGMST